MLAAMDPALGRKSPTPVQTGEVRVARTDELRGDGPHAVSAGGVDLVLVRGRRGLRAFEGRCPHQGALLGEGELDGDMLECRNHRWRFDADTGARRGGPQCLAACPVVERAGEILVDTSGLVRAGTRAPGRSTIRDLPSPR